MATGAGPGTPVTRTYQQGVDAYGDTKSVGISTYGGLGSVGQYNANGSTFADGQNDWCTGTDITSMPYSEVWLLRFDNLGIPAGAKVVEWQDTANILAKSNMPCILVAKHATDAIEQLVLNAYYLTMQRVYVVGLATVETSSGMGSEIENKMRREDFAMALFSRTGAPYLGCIKYSLSVSVPRCNQGNLVKLTTAGLDLLTVMKALNLRVSV